MSRLADDLLTTLEEARRTWLLERARYEDVKATTYKTIIEANRAGVSEVMLSTLFELDRGTIRKILGKTRK